MKQPFLFYYQIYNYHNKKKNKDINKVTKTVKCTK